MKITEEEVQKILDLVDKSNFGELNFQSGGLHLTLIKGGAVPALEERPAPVKIVEDKTGETVSQNQSEDIAAEIKRETVVTADSLLAVKAPMIGTFYSKPEPGASPFVETGTLVEEDTTVCLIETMKVFTSVKAGLRGYIEEVCVNDTQMVEYGQVLFRVRPE